MSSSAHAQKLPAVHDPEFCTAFYAPYKAAAISGLSLLAAAREAMESEVLAISYRLKSGASIRGKLLLKGLPPTAASAASALHDIAGLRAVLTSRDAVYRFARQIMSSKAFVLEDIHDYIRAPKPSGYRSLHLIGRIPVGTGEYLVPLEIQLRTAAMDAWACAEHRLIYKPRA